MRGIRDAKNEGIANRDARGTGALLGADVENVLAGRVAALQKLNRRLAVIRDRVRGVAFRHHPGFYLFGRPGTSKTFTVRTTLSGLGIPYHYHDGHLTPMGLFDLLA